MNSFEILEDLRARARRDASFRGQLLLTRSEPDPLAAFCALARRSGYELYEMDVIQAGEEFHAAMKRSTNGGGENSPKLTGEDDFYEMLMRELEEM